MLSFVQKKPIAILVYFSPNWIIIEPRRREGHEGRKKKKEEVDNLLSVRE
ncbi:hypothetical protein [Microcoleus anatoxicus]|uniref:Uncharacterized protein n=1 Tax=Microcoleus anatoxicus PTRS2 TaxID=2705321 RepID=A0ABU8YPS2_9CYAN